MDRIPLSDEVIADDTDIIEDDEVLDEETEEFTELDFNVDPETEYVPDELGQYEGLYDDELEAELESDDDQD